MYHTPLTLTATAYMMIVSPEGLSVLAALVLFTGIMSGLAADLNRISKS